VEEHSIYGGLTSLVSRVLLEAGCDCTVASVTLGDQFGTSHIDRQAVLQHYRLTPADVCDAARRLCN